MYGNTVVSQHEQSLNFKPAANLLNYLQQRCTTDAIAAESIKSGIDYITTTRQTNTRTAEQVELNSRWLDHIKGKLAVQATEKALPQSKLKALRGGA